MGYPDPWAKKYFLGPLPVKPATRDHAARGKSRRLKGCACEAPNPCRDAIARTSVLPNAMSRYLEKRQFARPLAGAAVDPLIGRLGVGELLAAAAIAAFLDEPCRRVEIIARRGPLGFPLSRPRNPDWDRLRLRRQSESSPPALSLSPSPCV
jgi:hypothetical protein